MKSINNYQNLIAVLLLPVLGIAQTVNTGALYVAPNTQFSSVGAFDNTNSGTFVNDGEAFFYSHFNNDGVVEYSPNEAGFTRFEGQAVQQLTGTETSYFYDVLFDNGSNPVASFELHSTIHIDHEVDFADGIVKDDDFGGLMIFGTNGYHMNTSDASHVDGLVEKDGNMAFQYPIGDARHYRYASISAPDNTNDVFTAKYFFENPDQQYPFANKRGVIEIIDNQEYWTITRDAGNGKVMVTLSWDENTTTPANIVASPDSAIHIVRWDDVEKVWVDEGGVADPATKSITTVTELDDFGVFTLARVKEDLILPGNVVIYTGVSPNQDGYNDYFLIDHVQDLPGNKVEIYNRWGVKVFETENYDTNGNVFRGYSEGRMTINDKKLLPTGTYFYILSYNFTSNGKIERVKKAGYLYLNGE